MKYGQIKELAGENFRRLTGVKKGKFFSMVEILRTADVKKARGGRQNKLSIYPSYLKMRTKRSSISENYH